MQGSRKRSDRTDSEWGMASDLTARRDWIVEMVVDQSKNIPQFSIFTGSIRGT